MADEATEPNSVELATELTIAWLSNPNTRANAEDVPTFFKTMHNAVIALDRSNASPATKIGAEPKFTPAVSVKKSLGSREHIISMIDGKPYKTLTRHLSTNGLTPAEYRARYNLKPDYPMIAPAYSEQRSEMAKKIGLGRKPSQKPPRRTTAKP